MLAEPRDVCTDILEASKHFWIDENSYTWNLKRSKILKIETEKTDGLGSSIVMRFICAFYGKARVKLNAVELGKTYLNLARFPTTHTWVAWEVRVDSTVQTGAGKYRYLVSGHGASPCCHLEEKCTVCVPRALSSAQCPTKIWSQLTCKALISSSTISSSFLLLLPSSLLQ